MNIRKTHLVRACRDANGSPVSVFHAPLAPEPRSASLRGNDIHPRVPPAPSTLTLRCGNSGAEGGRRGQKGASARKASKARGLCRSRGGIAQAHPVSKPSGRYFSQTPERASPRAAQTARELGCAHKQPCRSSYHLLFSPPPRSTSRVMLSHRPTSPPTDLPDILTTQLLSRG